MGFSDIKWGGFATIMVDTSTMSVGDKVRVKSIKTGQNYDKTVVTVGTPLIWETEIYKDYVKICMVQTISDVETEIGGVYRECDYGQTIFTNIIDKTSITGIQSILNTHREAELLSIGDEVVTKISTDNWILQVGKIDAENHEVILVSKHIWALARVSGSSRSNYTSSDNLKASMELFYSNMQSRDKSLIKDTTKYSGNNDTSGGAYFTAKVYPLNYKEITGENPQNGSAQPVAQSQLPLFSTQASRIKTWNGTPYIWFSCDGGWGTTETWCGIDSTGAGSRSVNKTYAYGVVPAFRLIADS